MQLTFIVWFKMTTSSIRIANISYDTCANNIVTGNSTFAIYSATSGTNIFAFIVDTSEMGRTISIQEALSTTTLIRIAEIALFTETSSDTALFFTEGILSAN